MNKWCYYSFVYIFYLNYNKVKGIIVNRIKDSDLL